MPTSNGVNGHSVETDDHLFENGVKAANEFVQKPAIHDLDASKLTVTLTKNPGKVPEPNSEEVWAMKTAMDHSK